MQPLVLFLHVPKTAGTTLGGILNQHYPRRAILHGNSNNICDRYGQLSPTQQQRLRLIRGHFAFGLHESLPVEATYITILRQPVAQTISMYYYWRDDPNRGQLHALAQKLGLEEFLRTLAGKDTHAFTGLWNYQTRMLCGKTSVNWGDDTAVLAAAKANLDRHFCAIGLTERFDESLLVLRQALRWQRPSAYVRQKVAQKRDRLPVSQSLLDEIAERNALDVALYRYAEESLDASIAAYGPHFARDLERQRSLNSVYQPFGRVYSTLRQVYLQKIRRQF